MTKAERATVQGFINKLSGLDNVKDETLKTLQEMNETHGDGHRWCSWEACLDGIEANLGRDDIIYKKAKYQYERFLKAVAQQDLIRELAGELSELGFWK